MSAHNDDVVRRSILKIILFILAVVMTPYVFLRGFIRELRKK